MSEPPWSHFQKLQTFLVFNLILPPSKPQTVLSFSVVFLLKNFSVPKINERVEFNPPFA